MVMVEVLKHLGQSYYLPKESLLPYPTDAQVPNILDPQSMTHCYFTALYKPPLSFTNNSEMMVKKNRQEKLRTDSPKAAPKGDVSISIGLSIQSFWSLLGKSVPLSHGISSIFDLARVYLEVQETLSRWD